MYNILICDDEVDIVNALKIYLQNENYRLFEAYDGEEALQIISRQEIHLVLLDIMMPKMDGISAMVKIRDSVKKVKTRILTLLRDPEKKKRVLQPVKEQARRSVLEQLKAAKRDAGPTGAGRKKQKEKDQDRGL